MAGKGDFEVKPVTLPDIPARGPRKSIYRDIINEFLAERAPTAQVTVKDKEPNAVYVSLTRMAASEFPNVQVTRRGDDIYLVATDS
ncbi:MAG: hypothetical protein LLG08_00160 [Actinomycetia bacterium]|nr:hypothetical protein [Actinomycetes bacterium]